MTKVIRKKIRHFEEVLITFPRRSNRPLESCGGLGFIPVGALDKTDLDGGLIPGAFIVHLVFPL